MVKVLLVRDATEVAGLMTASNDNALRSATGIQDLLSSPLYAIQNQQPCEVYPGYLAATNQSPGFKCFFCTLDNVNHRLSGEATRQVVIGVMAGLL